MWQVMTSKTYVRICQFIERVKCASQEFTSSLILNHENFKIDLEFYELYAIHKFGAKKNCTSEDKLVSVVMNLKNQSDWLGNRA